jgi:CRP/FNR family transcriptional regulator, cyclic AMP receptor protein
MDREILKNIPLFARLADAELDGLLKLLKPVEFEANKVVFWVGDRGDDLYVIQRGQVAVSAPDEAGREITLATLNAGAFFGDLSLLDAGPRTATIRTLAQTQLYALDRTDFFNFLRSAPDAAIHVLSTLGARQRETIDKLRGLKNANVVYEERQTRWQRASESVANIVASPACILFHIVWFIGWMLLNFFMGDRAFDPFPWGLLSILISIVALFISFFIMIAQNRSGDRERLKNDLDHQVNQKAQLEVMNLHQKLDKLMAAMNQPK